jgi:ribosomal protein S18 acetylase RimI-like enzyme
MIELRELLPEEIAPYFEKLWIDYRDELESAGYSASYAAESVENNKRMIFTDGKLNPGNLIFYAFEHNQKIGKLWLMRAEREGKVDWSIYDVETFPEFRGKGLGKSIMLEAENYIKSNGGESVSLSVFGNNLVARKLYESLGYETIRLALKKTF